MADYCSIMLKSNFDVFYFPVDSVYRIVCISNGRDSKKNVHVAIQDENQWKFMSHKMSELKWTMSSFSFIIQFFCSKFNSFHPKKTSDLIGTRWKTLKWID